ncbi:MAG: hypothetical protein JNL25_07925 [Rhodospirillaceae bacterium]|nr:hypothetical protein [Rhodospirillaceae bacterium]
MPGQLRWKWQLVQMGASLDILRSAKVLMDEHGDLADLIARRIKARAIRRCGELMQQFEASRGGRPPETGMGAHTSSTRTSVARDAGLSKHQQVTAIRVANVPAAEFERQVEAPRLAAITKLASLIEPWHCQAGAGKRVLDV